MSKYKLFIIIIILTAFIFPFFNIQKTQAGSAGSMTITSSPTHVTPGGTFTVVAVYTNTTGADVYLSNCSAWRSYADGRAITFDNIPIDPVSVAMSGGKKIITDFMGSSLGDFPFCSIVAYDTPGQWPRVSSGGTITITLKLKIGSGVAPGTKVVFGPVGCGILSDPITYTQRGDAIYTELGVAQSGSRTIVVQSPVTTPVPTPTPEPAAIAGKTLPAIFNNEKTTNLAGITVEQAANFKNFTVGLTSGIRVQFLEPIDLTSENVINKIANFDEFIQMGPGYVSVNSDSLPELNKKARIIFTGMSFVKGRIVVLRNGEYAGSYVSNVAYDPVMQMLSFEVAGFSKYEIAPDLQILEESRISESENEEITIKGSVGDLKANIVIYANEEEAVKVENINTDGSFEAKIALKKGINTIKVSATSVSGYEEIETFDIKYGNDTSVVFVILIIAVVICILIGAGIVGFFYMKKKRKSVGKQTPQQQQTL